MLSCWLKLKKNAESNNSRNLNSSYRKIILFLRCTILNRKKIEIYQRTMNQGVVKPTKHQKLFGQDTTIR